MEDRTQLRINEFIRDHLSEILQRSLETPPGRMVTITRVETAPDLSQSYVFVTVWPKKVRGSTLKQLRKQASEFQRTLDDKLKRRRTPKLLFTIDEGTNEVPHLQELFEQIDAEREEHQS